MQTTHEPDTREFWTQVRRNSDGKVVSSIDIHGKRADFEWTNSEGNFVLTALTTDSGKSLKRLDRGVWSSLSPSVELRPSVWYGEIEVHHDGAYSLTPKAQANSTLHSLTFHIDGTVTKTFADGSKIATFGACGEVVSRTEPDGFYRRFEWQVSLGYQQLIRVISSDGCELERSSSNLWTRKHDGKSDLMNAKVDVDRDGRLIVTPFTFWTEPEAFAPDPNFVSYTNFPTPSVTLFR